MTAFSEQEKQNLIELTRNYAEKPRIIRRLNIILKMMEGMSAQKIAGQLNVSRPSVYLWIDRYNKLGVGGLLTDASRNGRRLVAIREKENDIIEATLKTNPENSTPWSIRSLARAKGVPRSTVHRIWKKYGIKPASINHPLPTNNVNNYNNTSGKLEGSGINNNKRSYKTERSRDRTARLLKMQMLLSHYPKGLTIKELADRCSINNRTAYRDLKTLESELGVPLWEDGNTRGIVDGYFLPPINLTLKEALNIFLAVYLIQDYSNMYNQSVVSTFTKLANIVPLQLREQIENTLDIIKRKSRDERKISNLNKLTDAWLKHQRIQIYYQKAIETEPQKRIIEPYLIAPSILGRSNYIIGYSYLDKAIDTFKIDRIIGDVNVYTDTFTVPSDFNIIDYVSSPWDFYPGTGLIKVKMHFNKRTSRVVGKTIYHPSQKIEEQDDGTIVMALEVNDTLFFRAWVLGFGTDVEVLEPQCFRDDIRKLAESMVTIYSSKK